ncbi:MAG: aldehyde ferredoxin oxidoreductase, partial [Chitinivibrionales bacterium]|nr:aldehyde ferredoxin oxidoreductase [Chitinivibrionales bacterium]MBD3356472.1 aldehyde ferredoxin oxidoreductase [Chitinivibrionales bacterium]
EDTNAVVDSLTACPFVFLAASLEEFAKVYAVVTGIDDSAQDLQAVGERICYHERIMNAECGFTSDHDDLPGRFFTQAGTGGDNIEIPPINREDFLAARTKYYRIRGLTAQGTPIREKAERLGLRWNS